MKKLHEKFVQINPAYWFICFCIMFSLLAACKKEKPPCVCPSVSAMAHQRGFTYQICSQNGHAISFNNSPWLNDSVQGWAEQSFNNLWMNHGQIVDSTVYLSPFGNQIFIQFTSIPASPTSIKVKLDGEVLLDTVTGPEGTIYMGFYFKPELDSTFLTN